MNDAATPSLTQKTLITLKINGVETRIEVRRGQVCSICYPNISI